MYKFEYMNGKEMVMTGNYSLKDLKAIANKNQNIMYIRRNNHTNEILWERECKDSE